MTGEPTRLGEPSASRLRAAHYGDDDHSPCVCFRHSTESTRPRMPACVEGSTPAMGWCSMSRQIPLHFVTPVWGVDYTRTFVEVMLPSLLSPGNIPSLGPAENCRFKIYTTPEDARQITMAPSYARLSALMPVQIMDIGNIETNKYFASSRAYREAAIEARHANAAGVFLGPDVVAADGSIRSVTRLLKNGTAAILVMGVRATKETLVPELLSRYSTGGDLCVSPTQLVEALMRHLHPITRSHLYEGDSATFHPAGFFWEVGQEGLLMHVFHLHPVVVYGPGISAEFSGTIDDDLLQKSDLPERLVHIVADSDEMLFVEVSAAAYEFATPPRGGIDEIVTFIAGATNAFHRRAARVEIRAHVGKVSEMVWHQTGVRASQVIESVLRGYEALVESAHVSPGAVEAP